MIDTGLAGAWLRSLGPPPIVAPTTFAEREIVLPSSANARPGPLRLAPYQREPIDAIADEGTDTLVLQWAAQTGKSTVVNAHLGYIIACDPGPALHVSPTSDLSKGLIRERIDPLISSSPALRALVGTGQGSRKGSTGGTDSVSLKTFPAGSITFASSYKPAELAARAIRYLLLDEVDRFAVSSSEGCPVSLALKRTRTFDDIRRVLLVSTPTTRLSSRIDAWFKRGDQRKWYVDCPDCKHSAPIDFADLKWTPGKPETAHLVCPECGVVHDEHARRSMVENGRWVPTAEGERGIRSYHLTELSSLFSTMASVAQQFEAATTPEARQVFFNTVLATAYDAATEFDISASDLQQRAEPIAPPYREDMIFVTAGVDVQSNRLECTFLGHHADQTYSVITHFKLMGDTNGDTVWKQLDASIGAATFPTKDGRILPVIVQAVDYGFSADQVVRYVLSQRRKSRSCYAVKGVGGFNQLFIRRGARVQGQFRLMLVGVDAVKLYLQKSLTLQDPTSPGFIHLPSHLDEEYFEGLTAEELQIQSVRGSQRYKFEPKRGVRNEPLDCLTYSAAISKLVPPQKVISLPAQTAPKKPSFEELAQRMGALSNR